MTAAVTVAAPVVLYLVAPGKAADVLDEVRAWLVANNAAIMAVLLLVIGTQLLGKGIGSFGARQPEAPLLGQLHHHQEPFPCHHRPDQGAGRRGRWGDRWRIGLVKMLPSRFSGLT